MKGLIRVQEVNLEDQLGSYCESGQEMMGVGLEEQVKCTPVKR